MKNDTFKNNDYESIITDAVLIDEDTNIQVKPAADANNSQRRVFYVDHPPPPDVPSGGVWGQQHFRGPLTVAATVGGVLIACLPGLLILLFRIDRRDAYQAPNGEFYDAQGKPLGDYKKIKFVPNLQKMLVETTPV